MSSLLWLLVGGGTTTGGGGTGGGTGGGGTPPVLGGGGGAPPPVTTTAQEQMLWTAPDGTRYHFEPNSSQVLDGIIGRLTAPIETSEDSAAGLDGALLRGVRRKVINVSVPVLFSAESEHELRGTLEDWVSATDPLEGDGTLTFVYGDGTSRQLNRVRYVTGLEGDESQGAGRWYRRMVLGFRAYDPYFYDTQLTTHVVAGGDTTGFFPFLPLHLSRGAIGSTVTIVNDGKASAWPIWTVHGPSTGLTIVNQSTGATIDMPAVALTASQVLTIDTRPLVKSVIRDDGTNLFDQLTNASDLFALRKGANDILVTAGGSNAASLVTLAYYRRFLAGG
jgi:hypothetical protein